MIHYGNVYVCVAGVSRCWQLLCVVRGGICLNIYTHTHTHTTCILVVNAAHNIVLTPPAPAFVPPKWPDYRLLLLLCVCRLLIPEQCSQSSLRSPPNSAVNAVSPATAARYWEPPPPLPPIWYLDALCYNTLLTSPHALHNCPPSCVLLPEQLALVAPQLTRQRSHHSDYCYYNCPPPYITKSIYAT